MGQAAERLEVHEDGRSLRLHNRSCVFNPIEFPIAARAPKRRGVLTAWGGHVPFAMSLVPMIRPRVLVELGSHWGVSYCAFCQAVKEMRLGTRCFAVDTWQGDPHASFYGPEVLSDLKAHHDKEYALFSELIQSPFDDALPRFPDGSIDLLHIDGYHSYGAVNHDFQAWLPKLSDRGVILFHDIEVRDRETFGVWRFWDEVKRGYPHFEFYHSYGLGVLAVGESVPEGLRPILDATGDEADRIRGYFQNLGDHLDELSDLSAQKRELQGELDAAHAQLDAARGQWQATQGQLDTAREQLHTAREQLHTAREQLHATQAQLDATRGQWHAARAQWHTAREQLDSACEQAQVRAEECRRMGEELSSLRSELAGTREYFSHFRFRAVNKVANRLARLPRVYRLLRSTARMAAQVRRSMLRA